MSELHKFIFEGLPVRGMLVRLTDAWQELLQRRETAADAFPPPVRMKSAARPRSTGSMKPSSAPSSMPNPRTARMWYRPKTRKA